MGIERVVCKYCQSEDISLHQRPNRYRCNACGRTFRVNTKESIREIISKMSRGILRLKVNFKTEKDRVRIVPWGDVHVGAPKGQCDWDKALRELDYVEDTPDTYMIGMGDYMDCAQRMVFRGPNLFKSSLSPMEQYNLIEGALKPLAKKGKIIGLHAGNHEEWITQSTGIEIVDLLARSLKVPFLGPGCDITIGVNKQKYNFYTQHGSSNARYRHTKLAALMRATTDIFSDVYLYGHVHQLAVQKGGKRLVGKQIKTYYVLTGHFLKWEGSYAQAFGLDVCPAGCAQIKLFADRKDIHVSI